MREILFRGKTKKGKWVQGRLLADGVIVPKGQPFYIVGDYITTESLKGIKARYELSESDTTWICEKHLRDLGIDLDEILKGDAV